jgi:hypothetical protein
MFTDILGTLGRSRVYNGVIAGFSLLACMWLSSVSSERFMASYLTLMLLVVGLICDAGLRYSQIGLTGWIDFLNVILSGASLTCFIFDVVFGSIAYVSMQPVLSSAFALRAVVAVQHFVVYRKTVQPILRRLIVEESAWGSNRSEPVKTTRELNICYITSRIIAVSSSSHSSPEMNFLQLKYSNFLRALPTLADNAITSLSSIATVVEAGISHLFSNPVNVVVVLSGAVDPNAVLLICALLLRAGAVHSGRAKPALELFLSQRYVVRPDMPTFLPRILHSQLKIFETIMTKSASRNFLEACSASDQGLWQLRRVVISHVDAQSLTDIRLTVVDIDSGKLLARNISPNVLSPSSLSFQSLINLGPDTLLVFTTIDNHVVLKAYMNASFHLERAIASQSTYQYVLGFEDCDCWDPRLSGLSGRIQVVASLESRSEETKASNVHHVYDKDLLACSPPASTDQGDSNCLIV